MQIMIFLLRAQNLATVFTKLQTAFGPSSAYRTVWGNSIRYGTGFVKPTSGAKVMVAVSMLWML
jgi:hypothetical protein